MLATLACRYLLKLPVPNFSGRSVRMPYTQIESTQITCSLYVYKPEKMEGT